MNVRFDSDIKALVSTTTWTFAKTYASTWPHEYIVRDSVDEQMFVRLVRHIRAHGYDARFYSKAIRYFDEDGMVYWTMGAPIDETTIVNRCTEEQTYGYRLGHGHRRSSYQRARLSRMTVLDWLLDSDPAIRWQVLRDLVHAPPEVVAAERARVATEGWGARLLALQGEDGQWAGGACFPARSFNWRAENQGQPWTATLPTLQLLHDFGIDPSTDRIRRAMALVRDHCRWEHAGQPFFNGEVEPCINGRTVTLGAYFDQDMDGVVTRLLGEQLEDGGWNCEVENGSVRSSFATTINVLEGLLAHERATGGSAASIAARRRGEEYLLERKLTRRKSTGEVVNPAWLRCSFPARWHYDVLRALEYFRLAGDVPDSRLDEAIDVLRSKQQFDGAWLLENTHPGKVHFELEDGDNRPSRWNTLRALRVLSWYDQSAT